MLGGLAFAAAIALWRPWAGNEAPATASRARVEPARAALPAAAPSAPAPRFALQIGSFRTRGRAEAILADAEARTGLTGTIVSSPGSRWHRILLGGYPTEVEAAAAARAHRSAGRLEEAWVRPLP
jgi:cell division protein FtsN